MGLANNTIGQGMDWSLSRGGNWRTVVLKLCHITKQLVYSLWSTITDNSILKLEH
jgi:hypothetical protein